jgi:hypothetical protein
MAWVGFTSRRRLLPPKIACARCGHADTFHTAPHLCTWRQNLLHLWRRCPCQGYVPPGVLSGPDGEHPAVRLAGG